MSPRASRATDESADAVIFRCTPHVFAVATRWVERLLLREEIEQVRPLDERVSQVWVAGSPWAAWDLGLLLGLEKQDVAYVLLRVPWRDGTTKLALRTGSCLAVRRLPATWPLSPALVRARPGALSAAFEVSALGKPDEALMGYVLEPASLWTFEELEQSATLARSLQDPTAKASV